MKVYIESDPLFDKEIKYIFSVFANHYKQSYTICPNRHDADLIISSDDQAHLRISRKFYSLIAEKKFQHDVHFKDDCLIRDELGFIDWLSSAFYMLALIQEVGSNDLDEFGRFKFQNSYQKKFSNVEQNLVNDIFKQIVASVPQFKVPIPDVRSKVFLSHDIDSIHGSILQDSFFCLKNFQPVNLLKVLLTNLFDGPSWFNIDHIMKMESEYDFYSTIYWLVRKGKVNQFLNNSDYRISNKKIQGQIQRIAKSDKWENGLHKSAGDSTFQDELAELGSKVIGNRYHYLKFSAHDDFHLIEEAGIQFDASIGFADTSGFRNSYGLPYHPYNLNERKPFTFIECPLNLMDTTYHHYKKCNGEEFADDVISFFERHKNNCVISFLTHNNYYSEYKFKSFSRAIRTILNYLYESGVKSVSQSELIKHYSYEHPNKVDA